MTPKSARRGGKRGRPSGSGSRYKGKSTDPIILDDEDDWVVRPADVEFFDPYREYEGKRDLFTIGMHYGGVFHNEEYLGGEVRFIDSCNVKQFKLNELSSIMVALGCGLEYVCEFYYALPENSVKCEGRQVGHPLRPLVDDVHFEGFIALLPSALREVHVYCVELTRSKAFVNAKRDQQTLFDEFYKVKSKGVVIEEIEEPDIPRLKPTKMVKRKASQLLLGWHDRDTEFEEYMRTSLEKQRKVWHAEDMGSVTEDLGAKFYEAGVVADANPPPFEEDINAQESANVLPQHGQEKTHVEEVHFWN